MPCRLSDAAFNGDLRRRPPDELDGVVESVVDSYLSASTAARRDMLAQVTPRVADVLSTYGRRKAATAVGLATHGSGKDFIHVSGPNRSTQAKRESQTRVRPRP
jgi:hypothetical protein